MSVNHPIHPLVHLRLGISMEKSEHSRYWKTFNTIISLFRFHHHSKAFTLSSSLFRLHSKIPPLSMNAWLSNPASLRASSTPTSSSDRPGILPPSAQFKNLSDNVKC